MEAGVCSPADVVWCVVVGVQIRSTNDSWVDEGV